MEFRVRDLGLWGYSRRVYLWALGFQGLFCFERPTFVRNMYVYIYIYIYTYVCRHVLLLFSEISNCGIGVGVFHSVLVKYNSTASGSLRKLDKQASTVTIIQLDAVSRRGGNFKKCSITLSPMQPQRLTFNSPRIWVQDKSETKSQTLRGSDPQFSVRNMIPFGTFIFLTGLGRE